MNNDNRDNLEGSDEDRFATLDIDGINDLYYPKNASTSNNQHNSHNSTPDLIKIVALVASIIILLFVIYTAIVGILGSSSRISVQGSTTVDLGIISSVSSSDGTEVSKTTSTAISATLGTGTAATQTTTTVNATSAITTQTTTNSNYNPAYEDAVIFIDAGHGGKDPGSIGSLNGTEYHEADINLSVALLVQKELEKRGFTVVMSRETDVSVELEDRVAQAKKAGSDMFISIHCNSFSSSDVAGPRMYYTARTGLSYNPIAFATYFAKAFDTIKGIASSSTPNQLAYPNMKTSKVASDSSVLGKNKYYAVLCNTNMPSVLIEMGFITNTNDLKMLISEWWQLHTARAVADAIENAYNAGIVTK